MSDIEIKFKDGTKKVFKHEGRSGGSYTKEIYYEGSFVIIKDEWGIKTSFPAQNIEQIIETPIRW